MSSKLPSKMPATERQLRVTKHFNKSTSRIGQSNKVAGYPRYLAKVGDGDHYTNLWKMLQSASKKLAKHDYAVIPLDLETPVSTSIARAMIKFKTHDPSLESKASLPIIPVQLLRHLRCHSFQNMYYTL
jgi:hypothetical protein